VFGCRRPGEPRSRQKLISRVVIALEARAQRHLQARTQADFILSEQAEPTLIDACGKECNELAVGDAVACVPILGAPGNGMWAYRRQRVLKLQVERSEVFAKGRRDSAFSVIHVRQDRQLRATLQRVRPTGDQIPA
jgi:hypothetical protein